MNESQLTRRVGRMLREEFPGVWSYKVSDRFRSGLPDFLLCVDGQLIGVELKVGNNKPTRLQKYYIDKINASGGRARVCRSVSEVRDFLMEGGEIPCRQCRQSSNS